MSNETYSSEQVIEMLEGYLKISEIHQLLFKNIDQIKDNIQLTTTLLNDYIPRFRRVASKEISDKLKYKIDNIEEIWKNELDLYHRSLSPPEYF